MCIHFWHQVISLLASTLLTKWQMTSVSINFPFRMKINAVRSFILERANRIHEDKSTYCNQLWIGLPSIQPHKKYIYINHIFINSYSLTLYIMFLVFSGCEYNVRPITIIQHVQRSVGQGTTNSAITPVVIKATRCVWLDGKE